MSAWVQAARTLWSACAFVLWAGCGSGVAVTAKVVSPAEVPVRAYPEILIAGGHLEEDEVVLGRLEQQLRTSERNQVRRVDLAQLEPLRLAGRIPQTAVVMVVEVRLQEDVRQGWDTAPVRVCGAYGCQTQYQQVMTNVPWMRGTAIIYVYEGPTARLLQRHVVRTEVQGGDPLEMRAEAARELALRVARTVEVNRHTLQLVLYEVDVPLVQSALEAIEAGDWEKGRADLETAARSAEVQGLAAEDQARVFYDLGMARRFAPEGGYSEQAFDAAARALRQAVRLDPLERYQQALRALGEHRAAYQRLVAQHQAAKHNFAIGERASDIPEPPSHYQTPAVPAASPPPAPAPEPEPAPPEELFEPR